MKRKIAIFLSIIMVMLPLTAFGSSTVTSTSTATTKSGGTLIVSLPTDPMSFNPDNKYDDSCYVVAQNVFNRLVKVNIKNAVIPDLATSWKISKDAKTYTFNLAKGVKWHDGVAFTSADVKWTFDEIIKQKGPMASNLAIVKEITCPDDNTVVFNLKQSNAALLGFLSWYGTFILPKHIYENTDWNTNAATQQPVGTGPFKFVSHDSGVSVTLEANKDFFKGAPGVDKLVFDIIPDNSTATQAFYNGELDLLLGASMQQSEIQKMKATKGIKTIMSEVLSYYNVSFNMTNKNLKKLEVRQAIALGMNRPEILAKAQKGIGTISQGFYPPSVSWAYNSNAKVPNRDVAKAKKLLEKAGYKKDKSGYYFNLELLLFTMDPLPDIATVIKQNLKEIGINVKINTVDYSLWAQKTFGEKKFEATLLAGYLGPDPAALGDRFSTKGSMNFTSYSNPKADKLLAEAAVITNQSERGKRYKQVQQLLAQDLPLVPITIAVVTEAKKDYIKGHPSDEAYNKAGTFEYTYVTINK